jgi:hypothetical protein
MDLLKTKLDFNAYFPRKSAYCDGIMGLGILGGTESRGEFRPSQELRTPDEEKKPGEREVRRVNAPNTARCVGTFACGAVTARTLRTERKKTG